MRRAHGFPWTRTISSLLFILLLSVPAMQASSSAAGGPRAQGFQLRSAAVIVDETGDTVLPSSSNGLFCIGEGSTKSAFDDGEEPTSKVVLNAEVQFGAIVCGMPASGKTHTLAMLLGGLLTSTSSGRPRSLLCYLATPVSRTIIPPCEVLSIMEAHALLPPACSHVVLAPPLHMSDTAASYRSIPSAQVHPLRFAAKDITFDAALSLLGIGQDHPIFLDVLATVDGFAEWDYKKFRKNILMIDSHPGYVVTLQRRLSVLDACIVDEDDGLVSDHFKEGSLSIVDLSSLHGDADLASAIFEHTIRTYMATEPARKILVIDDSDKLLAAKSGGRSLFAAVSRLVRDQRSHNMQVLLSLQDPTLMPSDILTRSAVTIIHRLWSPFWLEHLGRYVGLLDRNWDGISCLETGDAIIMAPAAMRLVAQVDSERTSADEVELVRLGYEALRVRLRSLRSSSADEVLPAAPPLRAYNTPSLSVSESYDRAGEDACITPPVQVTVPHSDGPKSTSSTADRLQAELSYAPSSCSHASSPVANDTPEDIAAASYLASPRLNERGQDVAQTSTGGTVDHSDAVSTTTEDDAQATARTGVANFQPLVDNLRRTPARSVHVQTLFFNICALPGIPKDLKAFEHWISEAEALGLITRTGDEASLNPASNLHPVAPPLTQPAAPESPSNLTERESYVTEASSPAAPVSEADPTVTSSNARYADGWAGPSDDGENPLPDFEPLVNSLRHAKEPVHIEVLLLNLRASPRIPQELPSFRRWILRAETAGLISVNGNDVRLKTSPPTEPTRSSAPSPPQINVPAQFSPLVKILLVKERIGEPRCRRSIVSSMLRETPPSWLTGTWRLSSYLDEAKALDIIEVDDLANSGDGWVCLSPRLRAQLLPHALEHVAAPSSSSSTSRSPSALPAAAGTRVLEEDRLALGQFLPLVELLLQQKRKGRDRSRWYFVRKHIQQQNPTFRAAQWTLKEYLSEAAENGLVACGPPVDASDGWVSLLDDWHTKLR